MHDRSKHLLALGLIPLLWGGLPRAVSAQEAPEDERAYERARIALQVPREIRRAKRKRAREGAWVWTGIANAMTGYDSNVHDGPGEQSPGDVPITDSATFDFDAKLEGLHYFSDNDRFKFSFESLNHMLTATRRAADYTQRARFFYAHRLFERKASLAIKGAISHTNDSVTTSRGDKLTRDFENMVYRSTASFRLKIGRGQVASVSYGFKRKDYFETPGLNSLDWWRHGPKASWGIDLPRRISAEASYRFWIQNYDDEPSSVESGVEFPENPQEEHFFHTLRLDVLWRPNERVWLDARYRFRRKDDRFQSYESYSDHGVELSAHTRAFDALELEASGGFHRRNYDNRPGDAPDTLRYDLWRADALARYALTSHLAVYSLYEFETRDTNRSAGSTYRDYTRHIITFGVTGAY